MNPGIIEERRLLVFPPNQWITVRIAPASRALQPRHPLCGAWADDRPVEEIIESLRSLRRRLSGAR